MGVFFLFSKTLLFSIKPEILIFDENGDRTFINDFGTETPPKFFPKAFFLRVRKHVASVIEQINSVKADDDPLGYIVFGQKLAEIHNQSTKTFNSLQEGITKKLLETIKKDIFIHCEIVCRKIQEALNERCISREKVEKVRDLMIQFYTVMQDIIFNKLQEQYPNTMHSELKTCKLE